MIAAREEFEDTLNFEEQSDLHNNLKNSKDTYILGKIKLENQKKEEEEKYKSLTEEFNSTKLEFINKDFKKIFSEYEKDLKTNFTLIKEKIIEEGEKKGQSPIEIPDLSIPFIFFDSLLENIKV